MFEKRNIDFIDIEDPIYNNRHYPLTWNKDGFDFKLIPAGTSADLPIDNSDKQMFDVGIILGHWELQKPFYSRLDVLSNDLFLFVNSNRYRPNKCLTTRIYNNTKDYYLRLDKKTPYAHLYTCSLYGN